MKRKPLTADTLVWGLAGEAYYWEAEVNGVTCTQAHCYKSLRSAKRGATRWAERLGLGVHLSIEEGLR